MSTMLTDQIFAALAEFSSASRLYELKIGKGGEVGLLVEAFLAEDGVQEVGTRDVIALSTDAHLALDALLGQAAALEICLADGARERFAGEICEAAMLGSDGGLARYRIRICSWLWRLGHVRNSRVWQDRSVIDIVDAVFAAYQPLARWRWSDDTGPFLAEVSPRSYCCQYRESDFDFVRRILAEEGLCWRHEQTDDGPGLVLFADSSQRSAVPEDASSETLGGIRFHGARSVEESDSIQFLSAERRLHASLTTVLSYDYKAKQVVAASSPSHYTYGKLPALESFDVPGQYAFADWQQAQHYADLRMQEQEARGQMWRGRSTVRTLRAGTRVQVLGAPLQQLGESASFTVLRVLSIGINNMPPSASHALAELFGPIPELLEDLARVDMPEDLELVIAQAQGTGYANCFSAVSSKLVWRPQLGGSDGSAYPKPVAFGAQSAIVVGADGSDQPNGADELYCDRLGRVRIRFHWQESGDATCWVRVAQRSAGGGIGQQFFPRIGQEVLVQFLENDIDRPIIVGALYNGRGEGGVAVTPGGRCDRGTDLSCFEAANDCTTSAQANLTGGNSPVWHGASPDSAGHRCPSSQWGIRSKEFAGYGYSQLMFDDVDIEGRAHFKTTYMGSELHLGRLLHASDNYRGSFRGVGAELRTDAFGVGRAGAGLLMSSYKLNHNLTNRDPFGENTAAIGLMRHGAALTDVFNSSAEIHQSVALAARLGAMKAGQSLLNPKAAPLDAVVTSLSGEGSAHTPKVAISNVGSKNSAEDYQANYLWKEPMIAVAAQGGLGASAGQSVQIATGEIIIQISSRDTKITAGERLRLHTKQAAGILAGCVASDGPDIALRIIAAKDAVDLQAQAGEVDITGKEQLRLISAGEQVDFAAKKGVVLITEGGAKIAIEDGNIQLQCPGTIKVHAGKKTFAPSARVSYPLPAFPNSICVECLLRAHDMGSPMILRN